MGRRRDRLSLAWDYGLAGCQFERSARPLLDEADRTLRRTQRLSFTSGVRYL